MPQPDLVKPSAAAPGPVRSAASLTTDFVKYFRPICERDAEKRAQLGPPDDAAPKRTAIFAIHGISPQQRYAFQDQVATSFASYLNASEKFAQKDDTTGERARWQTVVHWPAALKGGGSAQIRPSALRIFKGDDPENVDGAVYDVYEGYWSPLSKGKTNIFSALAWLLRSTFLPTSSTAAVPSSTSKLAWDVGYTCAALASILIAVVAAVSVGIMAWKGFFFIAEPHGTAPNFFDLLFNPLYALGRLPAGSYEELIITLIFGFVLSQLVVAMRVGVKRAQRTSALRADVSATALRNSVLGEQTIRAASFHRWVLGILILALLIFAWALIAVAVAQTATIREDTWPYIGYAVLVVAAVGLLQFARFAADAAVTDVLGDIQIYTTHDSNSAYYSVREQIIATVSDALAGVLSADPPYDAIHVLGHSLGSTIGLDVLITLRKMVQEGSLSEDQWGRIRSFITFGTALEKTKFFFDVRQPTVSAAQDQWQNDVYGGYFTCKDNALSGPNNGDGIFWANIWYFRDVVANGVVSYRSDVDPGKNFVWMKSAAPHDICRNYRVLHRRPFYAWVHSDYLIDPIFWEIVVPTLLRLQPPPSEDSAGKWSLQPNNAETAS